jgi:ABC-type Fe3+/spermidine/putrescine transport system ATPase subunit
VKGDGGLRLAGVCHRYPDADRDSVTGIDLEVPEGAMLALVGPSGSGKSTVLRVAAGLEQPRQGRVLLGGRDVTALPPERRGLSVVSQRPHLFDHLDVVGNVAFGPRVAGASRREARARAARYLDLVHLDGLGSRRPGRLSGGQQQRVALARALATGREVLLLDEPFGSLDPELRASMHGLLAELRAAVQPTLLLVTHDLDEAALAEQIGVLVDGRLHQVGTPAELYRRPATLTVARLLGGFAEVHGEVVDGGSGPEHRSAWGYWSLPAECGVRGAGSLLVRREELRLAVGGSPDDTGAHPGPSVAGRVVGARRVGAREVAVVETGPGSEVEVELPLRETVPVGAAVRVSAASGASAWAVPEPVPGGPAQREPDPTDPTRHTRHADDLPRSLGRSCDHAGRD